MKNKFEKSQQFNEPQKTTNIKHTNIHMIGVPEGEERKKGVENIFD